MFVDNQLRGCVAHSHPLLSVWPIVFDQMRRRPRIRKRLGTNLSLESIH